MICRGARTFSTHLRKSLKPYIVPKLRLGQNFANMIFGLGFCPLSHTKRGVTCGVGHGV